MLYAASDPRGTYQGTIVCTSINEQAILNRKLDEIAHMTFNDDQSKSLDVLTPEELARRHQEEIDSALEQQRQVNQSALNMLKQSGVTSPHPLTMTIMDGPSEGRYRVEFGPASANYIRNEMPTSWDPANDSGIQESWNSDSFALTQTADAASGGAVYRLTGTIHGSGIAGQYAITEKGVQIIAGSFSVSKSGGGGERQWGIAHRREVGEDRAGQRRGRLHLGSRCARWDLRRERRAGTGRFAGDGNGHSVARPAYGRRHWPEVHARFECDATSAG